MAMRHEFRLLFFTILLSLFFIVASTMHTVAGATSKSKSRRFTTRLIHRHSIHSPYYNPNETISDRATLETESSIARYNYLKARQGTSSYRTNDYRADVTAVADAIGFFANISIGTPPAPQLLFMDTGSSLSWFQCLPCTRCFKQNYGPVFDPSKSSTYAKLTCDTASCTESVAYDCDDSSDTCTYQLKYADGATSAGNLATETFTFETSDEGITTVPNILFGCAHNNSDDPNHYSLAMLGLGGIDNSLAIQMGSKFSYCFGDISDPNYIHNQLILGDGAILEGDSTHLDVSDGMYYLDMEGISIGDKMLNIDAGVFKRDELGSGGVIIDSGTTTTMLASDAFKVLVDEVQKFNEGVLQRVVDKNQALCYAGTISKDLSGFPVVNFHFSGGAELSLDTQSFFRQITNGYFCMAVRESDDDLSVIGVRAQQSYNVGYDIVNMKITFQRIDCQLLEG